MKQKLVILLFPFFLFHTLHAQVKKPYDFELWLWPQVTKEFKHNWYAGNQYQGRFDHNARVFKISYFYALAGYKINKYLNIEGVYEYGTSTTKDIHQFYLGLTAKYRCKGFTISLRTAYQRQHEYFASRYEPGHEPTNEWRNRLTLRYAANRHVDLYAFCEPYLLFAYRGSHLGRIRNAVGINYDFLDYHRLNLYYIYQPNIFGKRPDDLHVLGISYCLTIPSGAKKIKKMFRLKKIYQKNLKEDNYKRDFELL